MSLNIKTAQGLQKINTVYVHKQQETLTEKDVNFYDYDGTLVKSYTAEEFAQLSTLPSNPTHEGLTAQGWNWSLANAKSYVASYGKLNIGQSYITSDGKTRLYITLHEGRLSPYLKLGVNGLVDIDWGDGTSHDTMGGSDISVLATKSHQYSQAGDYVITLTITGNANITGGSVSGSSLLTNLSNMEIKQIYLNSIQKVEMGNNISIGNYAFSACYSLRTITIPKEIVSIGLSAFQHCYSLIAAIIPNTTTNLGSGLFYECNSLSIVSLSTGITTMNTQLFYNCNSLKTIIIPGSVTKIGQQNFSGCVSLKLVIIPTSITKISDRAFSGCDSLSTINIPNTVTTLGYEAFYSCNSLNSTITIPDEVTRLELQTFYCCYSIISVIISENLTYIDSNVFNSCYSLSKLEFKGITAPTASDNSWFGNIPTNCLIYIPYTSPTSYLTASKFPSPSNYTYLGYNTFNEGEELPTISSDESYNYTWYATLDDATAQTNPINVGTGNKIYCRFAAV